MQYPLSPDTLSVLHELDLGQHTLLLLSDGSLDLLANDEQIPFPADNGLRLDREETYRLFVSLHEQYQPWGTWHALGNGTARTLRFAQVAERTQRTLLLLDGIPELCQLYGHSWQPTEDPDVQVCALCHLHGYCPGCTPVRPQAGAKPFACTAHSRGRQGHP
ncbi:MAG TPA: hypothetical protein VJ761_23125 [Ktedonobacteraceae bacterium]|nr:hypothetical protein [Ktedonobacteraceae bacterium]